MATETVCTDTVVKVGVQLCLADDFYFNWSARWGYPQAIGVQSSIR
jgi:hypothetical protein